MLSNTPLSILLILLLSVPVCFAQDYKAGSPTVRDTTKGYITMTRDMQQKLNPDEALAILLSGNERFVKNQGIHLNYKEEAEKTTSAQYPYAVLLSCIDSRTSSEIIFDQGMGDIFNVRIAGNAVNTDVLGSMEFACKVAGAKIVLVVGHSRCGAVKGACDHVRLGNLTNLITEIEPAVDSVTGIKENRTSSNESFVKAVTKKNVHLAVKAIREKSEILREMEQKKQIIIIGAIYDLESGKVELLINE